MKKKRVSTLSCLLITIVLLLIAMIAGLLVYLKQEEKQVVITAGDEKEEITEDERNYYSINIELDKVNDIEVIHSHVTWDAIRRPGEVREIKYIVIHETDNRSSGSNAQAHASYLNNTSDSQTGWHYTVDDHSIYHTIPDNEIAWNAGDKRTVDGGNMNGIGIEMCVNMGNDYEQTLVNTAALTAKLCVTYDLTVDDVKFHADFMDKECPHRLLSEGRKDEFIQMVQDAYEILLQDEEITKE